MNLSFLFFSCTWLIQRNVRHEAFTRAEASAFINKNLNSAQFCETRSPLFIREPYMLLLALHLCPPFSCSWSILQASSVTNSGQDKKRQLQTAPGALEQVACSKLLAETPHLSISLCLRPRRASSFLALFAVSIGIREQFRNFCFPP